MKHFLTLIAAGIVIAAVIGFGLAQVPASFLHSNMILSGSQAAGTAGLIGPLEEHTASNSAELDFTTCLTSSYSVYKVTIQSLIPASSGFQPVIQFSTNGGSTWDTTSGHYQWGYTFGNFNAGNNTEGSTSDSAIVLGLGQLDSTTVWGGLGGEFDLVDPLNGSVYPRVVGDFVTKDNRDGQGTRRAQGGYYVQAAAVNAFRIQMAAQAANLTSGTVRCYGYVN